MEKYWDLFVKGYTGYANYFWHEITHPSWNNYFYWLILVSLFFFVLEVVIPWRKKQAIIRRDFWLDVFYMFFNFFLFSLIIYSAASNVVVNLFNDGIKFITNGFDLQAMNPLNDFPVWGILLIGFLVRDFVQWWIHRLLHRSDRLWEFHKVHHSVAEMGFAAHLRYHWMENILYKPLKTFGVMVLGGFEPEQAYLVHFIAIAIGHFNHSNIKITWGPLKYILNNPVMHLYHHAYVLPEGRYGVNFGISLSVWDYIFGTNYIPEDSGAIELGFPGDEKFPKDFVHQNLYGFKKGQQ